MHNDDLLTVISENNYDIKKENNFIFIEAFYIDDKKHPDEKRKLMIRSYRIDKIKHQGLRTAKLKSKSTANSKNEHTKKEGLPITFNKNNTSNKWDWDIGFKTFKEKKKALSELDKNDIKFLNDIIGKGGQDFADYWNLSVDDKDEIKKIEEKYKK